MRAIKIIGAFFVFLFLAGCAPSSKVSTTAQSSIVIKNEFNDLKVEWFSSAGTSSIRGVAKFKARSGEVRYAKDFRIELMPYSKYTEERLGHLYAKKKGGHIFIEDGVPKFTPDPAGYHDTRKTMCNENGEFEFHALHAGEYYIVAFMIWDEENKEGNDVKDGGGIMRRITLKKGETEKVEMLNF